MSSNNRQQRCTQCAASPTNECFTPEERACWHVRRISQLANQLNAVRQVVRRHTDTISMQLAKIRTQAQALSHQQNVAEQRNRDLEALRTRASVGGVIPVINPVFIIHRPNCEAKSCTTRHCWCGYSVCDSCGQLKPRVTMDIGLYGPLVGSATCGVGIVCATCRGVSEFTKRSV